MNKEELKTKITKFIEKSKEKSLKLIKDIKEKTKQTSGAIKAEKQNRQKKQIQESKQEEVQEPSTAKLNIYDKKERDLKTKDSFFAIKPMSSSGQKVAVKKQIFPSFKSISFSTKTSFSSFSSTIMFLGSAFVSGWFLGASFSEEPKSYAAFIALFLIGYTIRYIKNIKGSILYGLLAGFFTNLFIFDWIYDTVLFGTGNYLLAGGSLLGLAVVLALPMMLFTLLAWKYKHKLWLYPIASACAWVALELIVQWISYKGFGFPWFVLGYSQYTNLKLIQISSLLGAYGISFYIVCCSFCAALILSKEISIKNRILQLCLIVIITFVFNSYGAKQLSFIPEETKTLKVAIVQPNTHSDVLYGNIEKVKQSLSFISQVLEGHKDLDIIIWPETTIPGYLEEGPLNEFMSKVSLNSNAAHLAGASAHKKKFNRKTKQTEQGDSDFVAAGLYKKGNLIAQHHKHKLVPFGEFLPFEEQLSSFYQENGISSLTGSFIEDTNPTKVLTLETKNDKTSFGVQICFESIFPILWRLEVLAGAEFFVNISNDGWFLNTAAPYQHLRTNVFRAVENSRPVLRSSTNGISAFINNFGKIEYHSNLHEEAIKIVELVLPQNPIQTFYAIYGDIFAFLCLFLTLVFSYDCLEFSQDYD